LLGIAPAANGVTVSVPDDERRFEENLAGSLDVVHFGLIDEYRDAVVKTLGQSRSPGWEVFVAAHGHIGSSYSAFRRLAAFLVEVVSLDEAHRNDEAIWRAWDRSTLAE
jgi:hypothetical protein